MKILIAPDSFKESLTAPEAAQQIESGFRSAFPEAECLIVPLADGGEGTVQAVVAATGGSHLSCRVTDPLGRPVQAAYGLTGDGSTAVIEMAAASGLMLVPPTARNPLLTTSYGTGELIRHALDAGVSRIIVGIGGSATNDGGAGMLQALGATLLDEQGRDLAAGGGALSGLARIDLSGVDPRLQRVSLDVACDVTNPLLGEQGASAVFGPQKGASPEMVAQLDANLAHYAGIISRDLGKTVAAVPGAGAAGGMGAALLALGGRICSGIELVMESVGFEALVQKSDLVITGEGRIDSQSVNGKVLIGVAHVAARWGKPVIAIAGSLAADADIAYSHGIAAMFSVTPRPCSPEKALTDAAANLLRTSRDIAATVRLARRLPLT